MVNSSVGTYAVGDSVYISFSLHTRYRGVMGIIEAVEGDDDYLVDLGSDKVSFAVQDIKPFSLISYALEWSKSNALIILAVITGIVILSILVTQDPKPQLTKDQIIEEGKTINELSTRKFVELSRQRELKRQLEASYMEVAKLDTSIAGRRQAIMNIVNPQDSNLSIQFGENGK